MRRTQRNRGGGNQRNRGGGPKRRTRKNAKVNNEPPAVNNEPPAVNNEPPAVNNEPSAVKNEPSPSAVKNGTPDSPDRCGICLEAMDNTRLVKKTKCGHRFHKTCLHTWCDTRKQQGAETLCPFCNRNIEKDCLSVQPKTAGQPMPEHRIRNILFDEDFVAHATGATGDEVAERRRRMKIFLEKLRFPNRFKYMEWNNITNFRQAVDASINLEKVREEMARIP